MRVVVRQGFYCTVKANNQYEKSDFIAAKCNSSIKHVWQTGTLHNIFMAPRIKMIVNFAYSFQQFVPNSVYILLSCFRKMDIPPGGGEVDYFTAAMGNIAGLGYISFPPEDNPNIAAATSQLDYLANTDPAFEDRMAFTPTTMPRHIDEAGLLAQLVSQYLSVFHF